MKISQKGEKMFSTDALGLLKYILIYFGLVFLAKEAVWEKLTETGKDRFDIVVDIGFGWTIVTYYMVDSIISFVQNPTKEVPYIIIGLFIYITLISYYSSKAKLKDEKERVNKYI